jgi:hypothetical protein
MRATSLVIFAVLFCGLAAGGLGCAGQAGAEQEKYHYVTGSYTPQDIQRNGPVTNGRSDVRVIDRSDINQSGGADVEQSLRQLGVTH